MMRVFSNRKAVANILGYVFSFSLVSLIMSFSVLTTTSIIDTKTHEAVALEAQNLANQVADAMVNAITASQSMPNARYYNYLELPDKLAGHDYHITIDNDAVRVYTKDGEVSKSCPNYNIKNLAFNILGEVSGGEKGVSMAYTPPEFLYKLDLGKGDDNEDDSVSHSPVKSGYFLVTENSDADPENREPPWYCGRKAEPVEGQCGGLYALDNQASPEPYIFQDTGDSDWEIDSGDTIINTDPDDDGLEAGPEVGQLGGLYALDDSVPGGEPYVFVDDYDSGGDIWKFDLSFDTVIYLDPDGDGINAKEGDGDAGGLYALDVNEEGYTFKDNVSVNLEYDDTEELELNPDWHYNHKYRIPIKIDNTDGLDLENVTVKIVLSSQDVNIDEIMAGSSSGSSNCVFYDHDSGGELPSCIDYVKPYDTDDPEWYFGASDIIKESIVFLVNVSVDAGDSKYIYLYYGSDKFHENNLGEVAEFFDDFEQVHGALDRKYCRSEDDYVYAAARDDWNFIYVVGCGTNLAGPGTDRDWWLKQFDVNGYEYDEEAVAGSDDPGWDKKIDGNNGRDEALSVAARGGSDPVIYVVGYGTDVDATVDDFYGVPTDSGADWWIKKFARNGTEYGDDTPENPLDAGWNKTIDTIWTNLGFGTIAGDDVATSVAIDKNYNVYVAGFGTDISGFWYEGFPTGADWWIWKFNSAGVIDPNWNLNFWDGNSGDGIPRDDVPMSIATTTDINGEVKVYVVGYGTDLVESDSSKDWWIMKFDGDTGAQEWSRTEDWYSGSGIQCDDIAYSVAIDENGDVYVAGYLTYQLPTGALGQKNWLIIKYDEDGNKLWTKTDDGEGKDDVVYTLAIDKSYTGSDWKYDTGEEIDLNPDRDENFAIPVDGRSGGLYALNASGEPFTFKDTGYGSDKWKYNGENILDPDPDRNGTDANVEGEQPDAGLYALDGPDGTIDAEPYTFKDLNGNWIYDDGELVEPDPDGNSEDADPGEGDEGGFYVLDDPASHGHPDEPIFAEPYTFRDLNHVYAAGYTDSTEGGMLWWIKKFDPGGVESIQHWDKKYSSNSGDGGSARSVVIDTSSYVYIAGYGTNLKGSATGYDWWIKKLTSSGFTYSKTRISPKKWSMSEVAYLSYKGKWNNGVKLPSSTWYDHCIISKDYMMSLGDDDLYIVDMKMNVKSHSSWRKYNSVCHSGLIILSQDGKENYRLPDIDSNLDSYVVSVRDYLDSNRDCDHSNFTIDKYEEGISVDSSSISMPYLRAANYTGEHLNVRAYVYKDDGGNVVIKSYLYHPSTAAPYENNISITDSISPYTTDGRIGIVNFYHGYWGQDLQVDWIRVIKSARVQPTITIGTLESINYGWKWPSGSNPTGGYSNPLFCHDPLHDDFINVYVSQMSDPIVEKDFSRFIIRDLSTGDYLITVTISESTDPCGLKYGFNISTENEFDFDSNDPVLLPGTNENEFKRVWFIEQVPENTTGDIGLLFYKENPGNPDSKAISSITVEKLEQHIRFEQELDSRHIVPVC